MSLSSPTPPSTWSATGTHSLIHLLWAFKYTLKLLHENGFWCHTHQVGAGEVVWILLSNHSREKIHTDLNERLLSHDFVHVCTVDKSQISFSVVFKTYIVAILRRLKPRSCSICLYVNNADRAKQAQYLLEKLRCQMHTWISYAEQQALKLIRKAK